jgi:GNAT superfamily N-acetyltransferase
MWVAGEAAAVAIWAAPCRWRYPAAHTLASAPAMVRVFGSRLHVAARSQRLIERRHPERRPHWYLHYLGAPPPQQGRGLGSALLEPVLARCDREGLPAFLETSTPRARALYERHGFRTEDELSLPAGGPPIWQMWRNPRRAAWLGSARA